ncbi:16S rRNA (uracil(1498)-N(3))-methyltransferase [Falsibacillus pallidus]|uniref:16S rRNA (uracil(1498)-N(3))-methyltransferase n=1 Tax=Falsibacillus pallidus TaxID=493781 RepID=UPI003D9903D4
MQRYFIPEPYNGEERVVLHGEQFHHIVRVLRMKQGDSFYIVYKSGEAAIAEIQEISNEELAAAIVEWEHSYKELPIDVTIVSGLPKGDKLELIVQKGTELGAKQFVPFIADRSIVKWDEKKGTKKVERWNKIALEAAEQSHRNVVPTVEAPIKVKLLLEMSKHYDYKLAAFEESAKQGETSAFAAILREIQPGQSVMIAFGPEGGLSEKEAAMFKENGFILCGLGPRILRTETAPLYALSAISYQFELLR